MIPNLVEILGHKGFLLSSLQSKMSLNDLAGQSLGLVFDNEELSIWSSLLGHSLDCVVLDHVVGEGVDRVVFRLVEILG